MKAKLFSRYPLSSILIYNISTILHFLMGGAGIAVAYSFTGTPGFYSGLIYIVLAFADMYIYMPLVVCPNCVYYQADGSLCISALNVLSRKIAAKGALNNFSKRAEGLFCPNNFYMASLIIPILAILPALFMHYSHVLLIIFILITGLMVFRIFVIFPKIACLHCTAKFKCPQAESMGVRNL